VGVPSLKDISETGNRGVANGVDLLVNSAVVLRQKVQVGRDYAHGQPVPIERAIVQHHARSPVHAIENQASSRHRPYRKSSAERFSESAEIGFQFVQLLTSARRIAKSRHYLIEDKER